MASRVGEAIKASGRDRQDFSAVLSYRSPVLYIRGLAVNTTQRPDDLPVSNKRPGFLFIIFHEDREIDLSGRKIRCEAGDMLLLSPEGRRFSLPDACRVSWMEAGGPWLKRLIQRQSPVQAEIVRHDDRWACLRHMVGIYGYLFLHDKPQEQALRNLLQNWMLDLVRLGQGNRRFVQSPVLRTLHEHIHHVYDRPWRLRDMTRLTGLSSSSLITRFSRVYGYTPMQYLIRLRVFHAAELILDGGVSVSRAAREVGYENMPGFYRNFRKHVGVSPEVLRQGDDGLDVKAIRTVRLERAEMMLKQGLDIRRVARETGFPDMDEFRRIFEAQYGRSPENIQREWAALADQDIPGGLVASSSQSATWHSSTLRIYSMGRQRPHDDGLENHVEDQAGLLFMLFHDDVRAELLGRWVDCPAGSLIILPSSSPRRFGRQEVWRNSWLWADGPWIRRQTAELGLPLERVIPLQGPTAAGIEFLALWAELGYQRLPEPTMVRNLLQNWLLEVRRLMDESREAPPPVSLEGVRRYMDRHFQEQLDLEALAEKACFSHDHFGRRFKEVCGMPPMSYLACLRMLQGFSLLADGNLNVFQAARETGYEDVDIFTDHFKGHFGLKPSHLHSRESSSTI